MSKELARTLARARTKAKLTSKELAERSGVPHGYIRALESDGIRRPNPRRLEALAAELGLEVTPLLAMTNQLGAALDTSRNGEGRRLYFTEDELEALLERAAERAVRQVLAEVAARRDG